MQRIRQASSITAGAGVASAQNQSQSQSVQNAQASLTQQQSLQTVKDLLEISIGSFTYLREIFPEDCYKHHMYKAGNSKGGMVTTKKLARGSFPGVDKLLDYLEQGVYDALEKQYLSSLILAIYIDKEQPQNVVETYTFNFSYFKNAQGANVPIMDINDGMERLVFAPDTPQENRPTLAEVRLKIQAIIKSLITYVETFQRLPDQKFLYLKVHYNQDCPDEYQPPHFGPASEHRLQFFTHNMAERPEKLRFGEVDTGHHRLRASVASVAGLLPENVAGEDVLAKSSLQLQDQGERSVLWDAEEQAEHGFDASPEFDDSVFVKMHGLSTHEHAHLQDLGFNRRFEAQAPIGIRMSDGRIAPIPCSALEESHKRQELRRQGKETNNDDVEDVEMFVAKALVRNFHTMPVAKELDTSIVSPFYQDSIEGTAALDSPSQVSQMSLPLPPPTQRRVQPIPETLAAVAEQGRALVDADSLTANQGSLEDEIMAYSQQGSSLEPHISEADSNASAASMSQKTIDTEPTTVSPTKNVPASTMTEQLSPPQVLVTAKTRTAQSQSQPKLRDARKGSDDGVQTCTCGYEVVHSVQAGYCGECQRKLHLPCYGYLAWKDGSSVKVTCWDHALPAHVGDPTEKELIRGETLHKLQQLAFMRRALYELHRAGGWPEGGLSAFSKLTGFPTSLCGEILTRLDQEKYVLNNGSAIKKTRRATKQTVLDISAAKKKKMRDQYFSPRQGEEARLMKEYGEAVDRMMASFTENEFLHKSAHITHVQPRGKSILRMSSHGNSSSAGAGDLAVNGKETHSDLTPKAQNRRSSSLLAGQKRTSPDSCSDVDAQNRCEDGSDIKEKKRHAWARASQCDPIDLGWALEYGFDDGLGLGDFDGSTTGFSAAS